MSTEDALTEAPAGLTADEKALNEAVNAHSEARSDLLDAAYALRDVFGTLPSEGLPVLRAFCEAVDRERAAATAAEEAIQAGDPMMRHAEEEAALEEQQAESRRQFVLMGGDAAFERGPMRPWPKTSDVEHDCEEDL